MCGRYTSTTEPADIAAYFAVDELVADDLGPRYNVAPTDEVYAVAQSSKGPTRLGTFRWGLIPSWSKDAKGAARMINARAETVLEKPAFRRPMERWRCIVPADGYYEWQTVEGQKKKQPWHITRSDGDLFAFAGLWASWRPTKGSDEGRIASCTIITTDANEAIQPVHHRMPVVLPPSAWAEWLDPANDDVEALHSLLVPIPSELLALSMVGDAVNNVRNDGPQLLDPPSEPPPTELVLL